MRAPRGIGVLLAILVIAAIGLLQRDDREPPPAPEPAPTAQLPAPVASTVGFRSIDRLNEHYQKHGHEFGAISKSEYLEQARALRDRPAGGDILEIRRPDGVVTRFDRAAGSFIAFEADLTIRTYFRPNDGEGYFRRQAARSGRSE
jgi:hypothetical protein